MNNLKIEQERAAFEIAYCRLYPNATRLDPHKFDRDEFGDYCDGAVFVAFAVWREARTPTSGASDLHAAIMGLQPVIPGDVKAGIESVIYTHGFNDCRDAAAELVAASGSGASEALAWAYWADDEPQTGKPRGVCGYEPTAYPNRCALGRITAAVGAQAALSEPAAEWVNEEQGFQYLVEGRLPDGTKLYTAPMASPEATPATVPEGTWTMADAFSIFQDLTQALDAIAKGHEDSEEIARIMLKKTDALHPRFRDAYFASIATVDSASPATVPPLVDSGDWRIDAVEAELDANTDDDGSNRAFARQIVARIEGWLAEGGYADRVCSACDGSGKVEATASPATVPELSDARILEISHEGGFGAFEFGDAQGDKRIGFARAILEAAAPTASPATPVVNRDALLERAVDTLNKVAKQRDEAMALLERTLKSKPASEPEPCSDPAACEAQGCVNPRGRCEETAPAAQASEQSETAKLVLMYRRHEEWARRSGYAPMDWQEFKASRIENPLSAHALATPAAVPQDDEQFNAEQSLEVLRRNVARSYAVPQDETKGGA